MSDGHPVKPLMTWGQWARKHHVRLTLLAIALLAALGWLVAVAWLYLTIGPNWPGD